MARISIEQKQLFIFLLVIIVLAAGIIIYQFLIPKPITSYEYYGIPISFRMDLRQADEIPVYPNELEIYNVIWNEENENITIAFVNSSENSLVLVEAFEITFKTRLAFDLFNFNVYIVGKEVNSYDLVADEKNPIIALIPPSLANKTGVEVKDNVIFIEGKTKDEFELATIKFLMTVLNIEVD